MAASAAAKKKAESLTAKQRLFIAFYLENGLNGTRAAMAAGYKGDYAVLSTTAYENLRKPKIRAAIEAQLQERIMGADEVLTRLSEHARASFADFIDDNGNIDLRDAQKNGKLHLLKKVTQGPKGEMTLELQDQQSALVTIARYWKLLTDKVEHTGKDGGPIEVTDARDRLAQLIAARAARSGQTSDPGGTDGSGGGGAAL